MIWGKAFECAAILVVGRVVIIDSGQKRCGHSEDQVLDTQSRSNRPGQQIGIHISGRETWKRGGAEESTLLFLVANAAVDNEFNAIPQGLGKAGGGTGALLIGVVEWRA